MNLPEEYSDLAIKLIELSNEDKVKWKISTSYIENEFILKHNKVIITIYPFTNPDEERSYYNFSFKSGDKISNTFKVSNWDYGYTTLEELYNSASRNAQEIRKEISDFLSEFND